MDTQIFIMKNFVDGRSTTINKTTIRYESRYNTNDTIHSNDLHVWNSFWNAKDTLLKNAEDIFIYKIVVCV